VRRQELGEGRGQPLARQPLPERPQAVLHPGQAGVTAEEDQPALVRVDDPLVVQQGAAEVHQAPQHGHVATLPLDGVGEEQVDPLGQQQLLGDLLDPEDHLAVLQRGHRRRADGRVLLVREGAQGRALDLEGEPLLHEAGKLGRGQRHAALPAVLVRTADPDGVGHGTLLLPGGPRGTWPQGRPCTRAGASRRPAGPGQGRYRVATDRVKRPATARAPEPGRTPAGG